MLQRHRADAGRTCDLRPEIDAALKVLRDALAPGQLVAGAPADHDAAVHRARRAIKTLRALLRLLPSNTKSLDRNLRDLARGLAPARDQHVTARTAEAMAGRVDDARVAALLRRIAAEAEAEATAREAKARVAPRLAALALALAAPETHVGPDALAAAVARLLKTARRDVRRALDRRDAEALHDARAKVVRLQLQIVALRRLGGRKPGRRAGRLDRLRDLLGDHHDLDGLAALVAARTGVDPAIKAKAAVALQRAMRRLERSAEAVAGEALEVAPASYGRRLARKLSARAR